MTKVRRTVWDAAAGGASPASRCRCGQQTQASEAEEGDNVSRLETATDGLECFSKREREKAKGRRGGRPGGEHAVGHRRGAAVARPPRRGQPARCAAVANLAVRPQIQAAGAWTHPESHLVRICIIIDHCSRTGARRRRAVSARCFTHAGRAQEPGGAQAVRTMRYITSPFSAWMAIH